MSDRGQRAEQANKNHVMQSLELYADISRRATPLPGISYVRDRTDSLFVNLSGKLTEA